MFRDDILEKIFSDREMQTLPVGYQSLAVEVLYEIFEKIKEERPYASISELFDE